MASHQPAGSSQQAHTGKVTVLNSGNLQYNSGDVSEAAATAGASDAADGRNHRRKVGTTYERSFAEAPSQQPAGGRQVLKAGKPVSSAPAAPPRPMTELEKEFAKRPPDDQRWLLSFPLALKQVYFSFAESSNHGQILGNLINKFPDLLAGNEHNPPAIQVAIEKGNWLPALKFIAACTGSQQHTQHTELLRYRCGVHRLTYPALAVDRLMSAAAASLPAEELDLWLAAGRQVTVALIKACPDLATAADARGRNLLHCLAERATGPQPAGHPGVLAIPLLVLQDLRTAGIEARDLGGQLGDALVARDATGRQPSEVAAASVTVREALVQLQLDFPPSEDQPMSETAAIDPVKARDSIRAALDERGKAAEFVAGVQQRLSADPRTMMISLMICADAVSSCLDWFKDGHRAELKQVMVDIGQSDLCHMVDCL